MVVIPKGVEGVGGVFTGLTAFPKLSIAVGLTVFMLVAGATVKPGL